MTSQLNSDAGFLASSGEADQDARHDLEPEGIENPADDGVSDDVISGTGEVTEDTVDVMEDTVDVIEGTNEVTNDTCDVTEEKELNQSSWISMVTKNELQERECHKMSPERRIITEECPANYDWKCKSNPQVGLTHVHREPLGGYEDSLPEEECSLHRHSSLPQVHASCRRNDPEDFSRISTPGGIVRIKLRDKLKGSLNQKHDVVVRDICPRVESHTSISVPEVPENIHSASEIQCLDTTGGSTVSDYDEQNIQIQSGLAEKAIFESDPENGHSGSYLSREHAGRTPRSSTRSNSGNNDAEMRANAVGDNNSTSSSEKSNIDSNRHCSAVSVKAPLTDSVSLSLDAPVDCKMEEDHSGEVYTDFDDRVQDILAEVTSGEIPEVSKPKTTIATSSVHKDAEEDKKPDSAIVFYLDTKDEEDEDINRQRHETQGMLQQHVKMPAQDSFRFPQYRKGNHLLVPSARDASNQLAIPGSPSVLLTSPLTTPNPFTYPLYLNDARAVMARQSQSPVLNFVAMRSHSAPPGQGPHVSDYMPLACIILFCCNPLFGGAALALAVKTNDLYDKRDFKRARRFSRLGLLLSLTGIFVTMAVALTCLVVYWPETAAH